MALKIVFAVLGLVVGRLAGQVSKSTSAILGPVEATSPNVHHVVGGKEVAEGAIPYMVALIEDLQAFHIKSFMCGGAIITVRTVITAAHCNDAFYDNDTLNSNLRGIVGTNRWNESGQSYTFVGNATHQLHDENLFKYDIGLLFTASPITLSDTVAPVSLSFDHIEAGVLTRVSGWGRIGVGAPLSESLLELNTTTLGGQECVEKAVQASETLKMKAPAVDPEQEVCVYHSVGHGVCNHDSGSPLVRIEDNRLIGVVSWGLPCSVGAPDMFVRLSFFKDWLQEHIL